MYKKNPKVVNKKTEGKGEGGKKRGRENPVAKRRFGERTRHNSCHTLTPTGHIYLMPINIIVYLPKNSLKMGRGISCNISPPYV